MKTILTITTICGLAVICGCGGRQANPVPAHYPGDTRRSCDSLRAEIAANEVVVTRNLKKDESKFWSNTAWFIFFTPAMDLKEAEKTEAEALQRRNSMLRILMAEKECGMVETAKKKSAMVKTAAGKKFYLKIAFFNHTQKEPISQDCRVWIPGFGEFYPARQRGWKSGGTIIEKAGPFYINKGNVLYFYPDYSDKEREITVPFDYSSEMNPKGSIVDMLNISVKPKTIAFHGRPIKNASGNSTYEFNRTTCKRVYQ